MFVLAASAFARRLSWSVNRETPRGTAGGDGTIVPDLPLHKDPILPVRGSLVAALLRDERVPSVAR